MLDAYDSRKQKLCYSVALVLACSRLRDGGGKLFSNKGCTIRNVKGGVGLSGKACYFFHNQQECRIFFSTFKPLHDFFFPK